MARSVEPLPTGPRPHDRLRVADPDARPLRLPPPMRVGRVEVDLLRLTARLGGGETHAMNAPSLRLLCLLAANAGRVLTRGEIWSALGGLRPPPSSNAVDAKVKGLRRCLREDARRIETVPGRGYRFAGRG